MTVATDHIVQVEDLHKHYQLGPEDLHVLRGVDLKIQRGEWLAVLGASGSGKSTLLHLIGGLDTPDEGRVLFDDRDLFDQSTTQRDRFRNRHVGFVFQAYHLLPELNVLENTMLTQLIGRSSIAGSTRAATVDLLGRLGLGERLRHRPRELSGGERQRVAIARALINEPDLLLADEPTGNLDQATGDRILDLFGELHAAGQTIVMVTHDPRIAERADRTLELVAGELVK
jgi:ABC-type lipoprotein export system ATPase subunit